MAEDASGLKIPLGWAVAVIVAFLALGFPVAGERTVLADGAVLARQPWD
jgi:uncharacterized iron-regulated membrane protein